MAKCVKCGKRTAKRSCPALGRGLCQLCCGRLREKDVHCPAACPHLASHKPYQEKRTIERETAPEPGRRRRGESAGDERLAWLAFHLEAALQSYAASHPEFTDKDAFFALDYAREKTQKGVGRIVIPGEPLKPKNEPGELLLQVADELRYQPSALLTAGYETYRKDERIAAVELLARGLKRAAGAGLEGRSYLEGLAARFDRTAKEQQSRKIITLG